MKVAIIGAGPCALSAGYELSKNGINVDIYEKSNDVGGLSRSIELWGTKIEIGPHFLLKNGNPQINQLLDELANKDDIIEFDRLSRIYWNDKFFKYPPRILDFIKNLGRTNTIRFLTSLALQKMSGKKSNGTLKSYVTNQMGQYIFANFFKDYSEKLWGIDCNQINEDYAKVLIGIGNLDFISLAKKLLVNNDNGLYTQYIYPNEGMSFFWIKLQQLIESNKGRFYFSSPPVKLIDNGYQIMGLELTDGIERKYDYVISTIPESALIKLISNVPEKIIHDINLIKYRNVICVFLLIDKVNFIEDNNLYIYNNKMKCIRITNYNRFRNKKGNEIIMFEYWENNTEEMWAYSKDKMMEVVQRDISYMPHSDKIKIQDIKIIKLEKAYPIPDMEIRQVVTVVNNYLSSYNNLFLTGRANQMNFNYGMSNALLDGMTTAHKIIKNTM